MNAGGTITYAREIENDDDVDPENELLTREKVTVIDRNLNRKVFHYTLRRKLFLSWDTMEFSEKRKFIKNLPKLIDTLDYYLALQKAYEEASKDKVGQKDDHVYRWTDQWMDYQQGKEYEKKNEAHTSDSWGYYSQTDKNIYINKELLTKKETDDDYGYYRIIASITIEHEELHKKQHKKNSFNSSVKREMDANENVNIKVLTEIIEELICLSDLNTKNIEWFHQINKKELQSILKPKANPTLQTSEQLKFKRDYVKDFLEKIEYKNPTKPNFVYVNKGD